MSASRPRALAALAVTLSLACRRPPLRDEAHDASPRPFDATVSHARPAQRLHDAGARDATVFSVDGLSTEVTAAGVFSDLLRLASALGARL